MEALRDRQPPPGDELFDSSNHMQEANVDIVISWKISSRDVDQSFKSPSFAKESPTNLVEKIEEMFQADAPKQETD